ncbi:hypothetical protein SteCoe_21360 [Stentor coeruleus]|uniref:Uncharacterized protein n=1 Tax=Stentor coeruleus TaxID=5963 RepID=A0A1R2BPI6_9CILI|nr:hypothetical protein SteCoe_21360 [Stentor coeruleus]
MYQTPRTPKPKFIPPIKTAASFLRTISDTSDLQRMMFTTTVVRDSPSSLVQRGGSTIIKTSYSSNSLNSAIRLVQEQNTSRQTRDISHLQDILRYSNSETENNLKSIHVLPTNLEQLKTYMSARMNLESRLGSKKSHVCFKERCLESFVENNLAFSDWNIFDYHPRHNTDLGSPTGVHDITNLKEWYKVMKTNYLSKIIQNSKLNEVNKKIMDKESLENFELIIKAGLKECMRQIAVQSYERGELLLELFQNLSLYWNWKIEALESTHKARYKQTKIELQTVSQSFAAQKSDFKKKEKTYNHDIEILRSDNLLKKVEIDKLIDTIKKLKAERIYRSKLDLDRYNVMIKKFKELKDFTINLIEDPYNIIIAKTLQKKKESLAELILAKIKTFHQKYSEYFSRFTEEQIIEHEMLTVNTECIFIEASQQTYNSDFTNDQGCNAIVEYQDENIETEEVYEMIIEEEVKDLKKPERKKEPFSIVITNEHEEQVVAFQDDLKSLLSFSSESSDTENHEDDAKIEPETLMRKVRVSGFYKARATFDKDSQTEENVFIEMSKRDEEELLNWMIKDRQDYLKDIQKQILNKKSELVNYENISKNRLLGQSFNLDESRSSVSSVGSFESFDMSIDADIEYLRKTGIIGKDVDIYSWKEGYNYGLEKAKTLKTEEDIMPRLEDADKFESKDDFIMKDEENEIFDDQDQKEQILRSKYKRTTLGIDDMKRYRKSTKIKEFHFQRKETRTSTVKVTNKPKFLDEFLSDELKNIIKQAKMSRKMVQKNVALMYSAAIGKTTIIEFESLAVFVYDEFCSKYGQKKVVIKKIIDFVSGLLKYPDSRRVVNFIKLLGISHKLGLEDFCRPKQSFNFFIALNRLIEKSKLGIISLEEMTDYQFIPAIRAIDCTKELLSAYFDNSKIQNIISTIEKNSHPDPKKINKFGIVDLEFLQELLLLEFDSYNHTILSHLNKIVTPFSLVSKKDKIHKLDCMMLIRYLCPVKFFTLLSKPSIESFSLLANHDSKKLTISIKRFYDLCFGHRLLYPGEIEVMLEERINETQAQEIILYQSSMHMTNLKFILANKERFGLDELYVYNWENKLGGLAEDSKYNLSSSVLIWRMLACEVKRLLSEC